MYRYTLIKFQSLEEKSLKEMKNKIKGAAEFSSNTCIKQQMLLEVFAFIIFCSSLPSYFFQFCFCYTPHKKVDTFVHREIL